MPIPYNSEISTTNRYDASRRAGNDGVNRGAFHNRMKALFTSVANCPSNMFKPVAMLAFGITAAFALSVFVRQFNAAYAADMDGPSPNNAMVKFRPQDQCEASFRTEKQVECDKSKQNAPHVTDIIFSNGIGATDFADIIKSMDDHYRTLSHYEKQVFYVRAILCCVVSFTIGILLKECVPFR